MSYCWFRRQENLQTAKINILKKMLLRIIHKTKKLYKKSQRSVTKTCHKKKKTRFKSIKKKKRERKETKI